MVGYYVSMASSALPCKIFTAVDNVATGTVVVNGWAATYCTAGRYGWASTSVPPRCTKCDNLPVKRQSAIHQRIIQHGNAVTSVA